MDFSDRCCALFNTQRICRYRMKLGDENEWHHISSLCRNRVIPSNDPTVRETNESFDFFQRLADNGCLRHVDLPALHPTGPSQILTARRLLGNHQTVQANDSGQTRASITIIEFRINNISGFPTLYISIQAIYLCTLLFGHTASSSQGDYNNNYYSVYRVICY